MCRLVVSMAGRGTDIVVLENKLGITDSSELAREEERLSKKKAVELFESGCLDSLEAGTYAALAEIHRRLFDEVYDFAGRMRRVNIAKGNFRFVPSMYLEAALRSIDHSYRYEGYSAFRA